MLKYNQYISESVRDQMTPKEIDFAKMKRGLQRLPIYKRIEKIFDNDFMFDLYSKEEIKSLLNKMEDTEDRLEKISNSKLFDLYTKDEIKDMINQFEPYWRFGKINDYGLNDYYTTDELDEIMKESDRTEIYTHFRYNVRNGNLEKIKQLMEKWSLNIRRKDPQLINAAVESGNLELVEYLIENGMNISDVNFNDINSWMLREYNSDIMKLFLNSDPKFKRELEFKKNSISRELEILKKFA